MPIEPAPTRGLPTERTPSPVTIARIDVQLDIDENPSFEITKDGPRTTRTHRVRKLPGDGPSRLWYAVSAPLIPRFGDIHPTIPFLPCGRVHAMLESGSTDIGLVTTDYFYPTGGPQHFLNPPDDTVLPQLEVLSSMQPATTQFELVDPDDTKKQIVVTYTRVDPETEASTEVTQGGSVDFLIPTETVRYTRREPRDPQAKGRIYKGRINLVVVFGDAPDMWLCTRLDGVSDDNGASFNVTYEFQRNIDTWNPTVVPTDPETGKPVVLSQADIAGGLAVRTVRVYPRANFFDLHLVLPG